MRDLRLLDVYRVTDARSPHHWGGWAGDETCGAFRIPSPIDGATMLAIASNAEDWDHVSVSRANRCPNWQEMERIASLFFKDTETAMQLHVPAADHLNLHPFCLHWWRPHSLEIPRPPATMVAVPGTLEDNRRYLADSKLVTP